MITIKNLTNDKGQQYPVMELTENEKETITSILFNGVEWVCYQGDEPPKAEQHYVEPVEEKTDLSKIDIDSLTDEQINKLKACLGL